MSGWSAAKSASRSGRRSFQRSARFRMFRLATWSRVIGAARLDRRSAGQTRTSSHGPPRTRPRSGRHGPRSRAARSTAQGRCRRLGPGPGRPCRTVRRPVSWAARGMPIPWSSTDTTTSGRARLAGRHDPHRHLATVRAELHGVVDEVDDDLAKPLLGPVDRRQAVGRNRHDQQLDPLALGEQSKPLGRGDRQPGEIDLVEQEHRPARFDPGQVEQLADHLDEMVRSRPRS